MKKTLAVSTLTLVLTLASVSAPLLAARPIASTPYSVRLEQTGISEDQTLSAIHADFDNDGVEDIISPTKFFYFYSLSVTSGATGQPLLSVGSGNGGFNGYSVVSFNPDGSYPSIVFAVYRYDPAVPTGFASIVQKIAINNNGVFTVQDLPVSLVGRDVACTRNFPTHSDPVCFFASYYDYAVGAGTSKLVEVHPDGTATDITGAAGLPFPITSMSPLANGRFMVGATWNDFSGDGLPDLVAVGQHSQVLAATSNPTGVMTYSWVGVRDDYMRAFYSTGNDLASNERPPCVYLAMEQGQASRSDLIMCFNQSTKKWYDLALPAVEWSFERPVRFWRQVDGKTVFAANNAGILNLFSLIKQ